MAKEAQTISWEAQEFIEYNRNIWWYIGLFAVGIGLCALAVFLQWWSFIPLVVVCVIAVLTMTIRPPRIVDALGARLPMEEVKLDFLDKIVNLLRI